MLDCKWYSLVRLIIQIYQSSIQDGSIHFVYCNLSFKQTEMQTIIDSFLKPPHTHHFSPPVINVSGTPVLRKDHSSHPLEISVYSTKKQEFKGVVLYCHSFGSNKYEAEMLLPLIVKNQMKLVTFNFMRVTNDGKFCKNKGVITFGYKESNQVDMALDWIQEQNLGNAIVWGRSMGAVATLRSQLNNPRVIGMVLDSPYQSLKQTILQVMGQRIMLPNFLIQSAYGIMKSTLQKSLGFQIQDLDLSKSVNQMDRSSIPCIFIVSKSDSLSGQATQNLYKGYKGSKELMFTSNSHNAPREQNVLQQTFKNLLVLIRSNEKQKARKEALDTARQTQVSISSSMVIENELKRGLEGLKLDKIGCRQRRVEVQSPTKISNQRCIQFCSMIL